MEISIVTAILVLTIGLLISEKLPVDITAIGIMVALVVTGILTPRDAVSGFASPAVITVGAMFMLSRGLIRTGAVGRIGEMVIALSKGRPRAAVLVMLLIVGVASAFVNNTAVVVLFIPIALSICCELEMSPSKLLLPISFASILAGTCTLIGTSTNIIISGMSEKLGYGPLGMFELATLGAPLAAVGFAYLFLAAPKLLPNIVSAVCELDGQQQKQYLAEFRVPASSKLAGEDAAAYLAERFPTLRLIEAVRATHILYPYVRPVTVRAGDLLLLKGSANDLVELLGSGLVELPFAENGRGIGSGSDESLVVEVIISPQSTLLGESIRSSGLNRDPNVHVIALQRRESHYTDRKIRDMVLKIGDVILVRCPEAAMARLREEMECIVVEDIHHRIIHKRLGRRAFAIFAAMVAAAGTGVADIMTCALTAAFLMILTGCVPLRDAYRSLEPRVLLIIVGTIALSKALESTGASALYARLFLGLFSGMPPVAVLAGVILLTSIGTLILSNNATAILILPIAVSTAAKLGVDPKPFIMAVCYGASACYATPIGYQTNLLVYGPGGYRFIDYVKLGGPLNLLVLAAGAAFIPVIWPF